MRVKKKYKEKLGNRKAHQSYKKRQRREFYSWAFQTHLPLSQAWEYYSGAVRGHVMGLQPSENHCQLSEGQAIKGHGPTPITLSRNTLACQGISSLASKAFREHWLQNWRRSCEQRSPWQWKQRVEMLLLSIGVRSTGRKVFSCFWLALVHKELWVVESIFDLTALKKQLNSSRSTA